MEGQEMADILTLGELLIDLTQTGTDNGGNGVFTAFPGGAPANVAVAAARLGADTGFIGKVGRDAFGKSLAETLRREGVDITGLYASNDVPTTLAIVSVDETGEREFSFYRSPGADTQLTSAEALSALTGGQADTYNSEHDYGQDGITANALILHIGSLSMTTSPGREACVDAAGMAKSLGMLISYDPNYREALWESREQAVEMMKRLLPLADILKVSDEEMVMLTGTQDFEEGSRMLAECGPSLVMITLGADGVFVRCADRTETVPGFSVTVADTNGAGDTFLGAMLAQLAGRIRSGEGELEWDDIMSYVKYANKAASITCSRSGAIPAMPRAEEITLD